MNCLSFVSSDKWTFTAYIQIYSYSNASHVFIYTFWIYVFHIQCPTKVFERCNTVDSSSFSFAPSVNIIAKWKYWYVHLMLGYRFSNSNVQVCTIVFKMNTKVWNKNCKREIIFRIHGDGKSYNEIGENVKEWGNACKQSSIRSTKEINWKNGESYHSRIKKNLITSAPQVASMAADMFHKEIHLELCRRILRNNDFHDRVPR